MNKDDFFKACLEDPDFEKNNCFMLPIDLTDLSDHEGANEVRVVLTSRPKLKQQLKEYIEEGNTFDDGSGIGPVLRPNIVPITVSGPSTNPTQDDGFNRHREIRALAKDNPKITHIFATRNDHKNEAGRPATSARTWSMLNSNETLDEAPATDADYINAAVVDIKNNLRFGSDYENTTLEKVIGLIQSEVKYKLHGTKVKNMAAKVLEQLPEGQKKLKNYADKDAAGEAFCDLNEWGLKPTHSGCVCVDKDGQEWVIYYAGTKTWINQNMIHGVWNHHLKNPGNSPKVMVVGFNEKIWSSNGDLSSFREKQVSDIERHNGHPWLSADSVMVDRYVALPQIVKGLGKEDMNKLHSVVNFS